MAEVPKPAPKLTVAQQEALDNARDAAARKKEEKAPTTKTGMGDKLFAKGGSIADKGRKFRTGGRPAAINKQNTQHGSMDMPFKSLKKFAGMKAGGKVKKYEDGGDIGDYLSREKTESDVAEKAAQPDASAPKAARKPASYGNEGRRMGASPTSQSVSKTPSDQTNAGAVTGRTMYAKSRPSDEQKEKNTENFRDMTMTAASMSPMGRVASFGASALKAASAARAARTAGAMEKAAEGTARQVRLNTPEPRNSILDEVRKRVIKGGKNENSFTSRAKDTMRGEGGLKKGGNVKAKMGMKMGGMPMKDGKPAFLMGKKKMMGGGMAGYAKGGGIESKGKTKGTVIRMASGGSVSSASRRADGIAQRGKTRC